MPFPPGFRLQCDNLNSQFTLTEEGQNRRKVFASFEDAYEYAEAHATGQTSLTLCNARGQEILKTAIFVRAHGT